MPHIYGRKLWESFTGLQYCDFSKTRGSNIGFISPSDDLSICPSKVLCIWLSQKNWFKFDETWYGYSLAIRNWLDFGPCELIFKVIWGQKVANQNHSFVHNTVQTSGLILMKLHRIMHWWCLMNWINFGVCALIFKVTEVKDVRYLVSEFRVIFIRNKVINFKFGMGHSTL